MTETSRGADDHFEESIRVGTHIIRQYFPSHVEFLNRMTVIYGGTNTGKTRTAKYIIEALRKHIGRVFLFSSTESQNGAFRGFVP